MKTQFWFILFAAFCLLTSCGSGTTGSMATNCSGKMSRAWINFARTGNPNVNGLPEWKPYTPEEGATMFFNNTCEVKYNHDKELLDIVMSFPVRGF